MLPKSCAVWALFTFLTFSGTFHFLAYSTPATHGWPFIIWVSSQMSPYERGFPWCLYLQATLLLILCHTTLVLVPSLNTLRSYLLICLLLISFSYHDIKLRAAVISILFSVLSLCLELWLLRMGVCMVCAENHEIWSLITLDCNPGDSIYQLVINVNLGSLHKVLKLKFPHL